MVLLKIGRAQEALATCTAGLLAADRVQFSSNESAGHLRQLRVKLLYRRGTARMQLEDLHGALLDMRAALLIEPQNERVAADMHAVASLLPEEAEAFETVPAEEGTHRKPDLEQTMAEGINTMQVESSFASAGTQPVQAAAVDPKTAKTVMNAVHEGMQDDTTVVVDPPAISSSPAPTRTCASQVAAPSRVPPTPRTAYEFEAACHSLRHAPTLLAQYLSIVIEKVKLKKLFRRPVEADTVSQVTLGCKFLADSGHSDAATKVLARLGETVGFGTTSLMLSQEDKDHVNAVLERHGKATTKRVRTIRSTFRLY